MLTLVILALFLPLATSAPSGIGTSADEGCLCHGEKNSDTSILVTGLPDFFESNTTYNFSIELTSENIPMESGKPVGGFRLLISGGMISFDEEEGLIQPEDGGWTHTEAGNTWRMWNFSFTSPLDNSTFVDFTIHGNAVNGNQASSGDEWNGISIRLPGAQYDGEMLSEQANNFTPTDYAVGMVLLLALSSILLITLRD